MALEVNNEGVKQLLENHKDELSTEVLEQLEAATEDDYRINDFREKKEREDFPTWNCKSCTKSGEMLNFMARHHPNKAVATCSRIHFQW